MAVYIFKQAHPSPTLISLVDAGKQLKFEKDWEVADELNEKSLVEVYIQAAIKAAENYIGLSINQAKFKLTTNQFTNNLAFTRGPISAIESITYKDEAGDVQTLDNSLYELRPLDRYQQELFFENFDELPTVISGVSNAVTINITTGYGAADELPEDIRSAIYLIMTSLYENRQDSVEKLPKASTVLLQPYRIY
ncbi:hypothetical protein ACFQZW_12920 [Lutibacter aestuarii]|uniref:Phage gp6-like head-tail connector protein n=1 Tax=Lutibacter aestuarii TaxID=861111 RepID=A0ABW2Z8P8_9FLAO